MGRVGRPSLLGTAARTAVIAGTATAVSGKVAASQAASQAAHARPEQLPAAPPATVAVSEPAKVLSDEAFDQLKKLGELRQAGILTEEEFSAKKALLLG